MKGRGNYAGTLEVDIGNEMTVVFDAVYGAEGAILRTHTTQIPGEPYMLPPTPYFHGYEFLGWFTERVGGTELSGSTIAHLSDASTYYAHWQVSRFHVSFDCGVGVCDGCEDGLDVAFGSNYARLPRPSRQGYLFDGWYASPDFDKTSKVQDGDAVANEDIVLHAKWERRRLWHTDSLFHVEKSTTWDGYVIGDDESAVGVVQLKVGKPNKKTGLSKVSATVQIVGEKKLNLKGTTFDGQLEMVAKDGRKLSLRLSESGMSGDFNGMSVDGARNVFKAGDAASKLVAAQILRHWQGRYVTVFKGNSGYGGLALEVKSKGNVRVAGALADGTKVNGKAQLLVGERECAVPFCWTKNSAKMSFLVWFCEDGSLEISNLNDPGIPAAIANQKTGAYLPSESALRVSSADISAMLGSNVLVEYLPDGVSVVQNGGKWVLAKAGKLSIKRGEIQVKGDNPSGLKLSYKLNDSTFKGSFTAYSLVDGKLKKQKFEILGIVIDGKGYGTAVAKKIGCVPVTIGNE